MKRSLLIFSVVLAACGGKQTHTAHATSVNPELVRVEGGVLRGVRTGAMVSFKGIPYAAPPIGPLRWRAPRPVVAWKETRDANAFGQGCVQLTLPSGKAEEGNEDCLTLNVWAPVAAIGHETGPLPVMVYVHGGYNVFGSSGKTSEGRAMYDGAALAERANAIVVTINYRLGALGFFAHPALGEEGGNQALLDQIAALRWVQTNVHAFGGDPGRVLLFGQSAGATNTCALFASPMTKGLFSRALMHSGACNAKPRAYAMIGSTKLAQDLGCDTTADPIACLRAKDARTIAATVPVSWSFGGFHWGPSIDGHVVPAPPRLQIAGGLHNHVPFTIGTTADEFSTLAKFQFPNLPKNEAEYKAAILAYFGLQYQDAILAQYPGDKFTSYAGAFIAATTDGHFTCPSRAIARLVASHQSEPVRRYFFAHAIENGPAHAAGAGHTLDILFLFHTYPLKYFSPTAAEIGLADSMADYWGRFAATGDPNGGTSPKWLAWDETNDPFLTLDTPVASGTALRKERCDFWDALVKP